MLYKFEFATDACPQEDHLEYCSTYINYPYKLRECPFLKGDPCRCCDVCKELCTERYYMYESEVEFDE